LSKKRSHAEFFAKTRIFCPMDKFDFLDVGKAYFLALSINNFTYMFLLTAAQIATALQPSTKV
jgi:hypothetical protein